MDELAERLLSHVSDDRVFHTVANNKLITAGCIQLTVADLGCCYLRQGGNVLIGVCLFVCSSVCLSVCLLATSRKSYSSDLHENFTRDVSVDEKVLIKFWKSSASRSGSRNILEGFLNVAT